MKNNSIIRFLTCFWLVTLSVHTMAQDSVSYSVIRDEPEYYNTFVHLDLAKANISKNLLVSSGLGFDIIYKRIGTLSGEFGILSPVFKLIDQSIIGSYDDEEYNQWYFDLNASYNFMDYCRFGYDKTLISTEDNNNYKVQHFLSVKHFTRSILSASFGFNGNTKVVPGADIQNSLNSTYSVYIGSQGFIINNCFFNIVGLGDFFKRDYYKSYLDLLVALSNNATTNKSNWGWRFGFQGSYHIRRTPHKARWLTSCYGFEFGGRPGVKGHKGYLSLTYGLAFRSRIKSFSPDLSSVF
ncbi:MAG: hypothetical protein NTV01_20430 [Bacteroidia bacterium]|nr:hypothetical protein [Bacteroidia bacterium]